MLFAWIGFALVLAYFELHHQAFYAVFAAVGALAAAAVAFFAPEAIVAQFGAAAVVTAVGVGAVRPLAKNAFQTRHSVGHVARGVHGGLIGQEAVTIDQVGNSHHVGHVRLAGESWLAVTPSGVIAADTPVYVAAVQGTTLEVWPLEARAPLPPTQPPAALGQPSDQIPDQKAGNE